MQIQVRFWGVARRLAGGERLCLELAEGARVAEAAAALGRIGELAQELPRCAFALGDTLVPRSHALGEGDELAVLPPVGGG